MCDIQALGPLLGHCAHLGKERMDARLASSDVTPAQTHVLLYLHHQGGEASQSDITAHLKVKPSTANGILGRMEEKGLVERSVSDHDGRCRRVALTEKGAAEQAFFKQVFTETESLLVRGLSEQEREQLFALLLRVYSNLEEDRTK